MGWHFDYEYDFYYSTPALEKKNKKKKAEIMGFSDKKNYKLRAQTSEKLGA